jgi:hypothetical protein
MPDKVSNNQNSFHLGWNEIEEKCNLLIQNCSERLIWFFLIWYKNINLFDFDPNKGRIIEWKMFSGSNEELEMLEQQNVDEFDSNFSKSWKLLDDHFEIKVFFLLKRISSLFNFWF